MHACVHAHQQQGDQRCKHRMRAHAQGIIGNSYGELAAASKEPKAAMEGVQEEFRMESYFSTIHVHNAFGIVPTKAAMHRRMLFEGHPASFPLHFSAAASPVHPW